MQSEFEQVSNSVARNTKYEDFTSMYDPQIKYSPDNYVNRGAYVGWTIDLEMFFGIDINYPGIVGALNKAFVVSRHYTPYDTGLTYHSMKLRTIDSTHVEVFYDPKEIVGKKRKGVVVTEYYPKYIAEHPKRFNWIAICMKKFYDELFVQVKELRKKKKEQIKESKSMLTPTLISLDGFVEFKKGYDEYYKRIKNEAKRLQDEERERIRLRKELIKKKRGIS